MSKYGYYVLLLSSFLGWTMCVPTAQAQSNAEKRARLENHAAAAASAAADCEIGQATADLDANNVRARLYNSGNLFWKGAGNVYTVPIDGEADALFASGIWIGGFVDGDFRFAGTAYGPFEYWPGPLDDQGQPPTDCAAFDRIYKVSRDDVAAYEQTGTATTDLQDWPWQLDAPVVDGDGVADNYDLAAGDRLELLGDQTAWWVMNDAGGVKAWSETEAIGLEVQVTAYASASDDALDNTTLYRYTLLHKGEAPLEAAYFGFWVDPDLGNASDDFVGSDTLRDLGYVYNSRDVDAGFDGYGDRPPALGYVIVEGLRAEDDGLDNDGDGAIDEDGERRGVDTFIHYIGDSNAQGNPDGTTRQAYDYMRGFWRDGTPLTVGGTGYGGAERTRFAFPASPPAYWSEENNDGLGARNVGADRRFVMSMGPFTMNPGDVQDLTLAIVWAQADDRLASVSQLKRDVDALFPRGAPPLPDAPVAAPLLISPFDGADRVSERPYLAWSSLSDSRLYRLHLAVTPDFDSLEADVVLSQQASFRPALESDRVYYWRVKALNAGGSGPWSATWSFSTVETAGPAPGFTAFETVANAAGPLDPPVGAAADFQRFPGERPAEGQQVAAGLWLLHAADDGAVRSYDDFLRRVTAEATLWPQIARYDYEMRFTQEGSWTVDPFATGEVFEVPFELWRIGRGTPDDPSDDVRMIPYVRDADWTSALGTDGLPAFNLMTQHTLDVAAAPAYNDGYPNTADHLVSSGDNDPQTDWIYWHLPFDETPGDAGYRAWETDLLSRGEEAASIYGESDRAVMERMVLVNWNGGDVEAGVYDQAMPEAGTVFRLRTTKADDVTYEADLAGIHTLPTADTGADGLLTAQLTDLTARLAGTFGNLSSPLTAARLYSGEAGQTGMPLFDLNATLDADRRGGTFDAALNAVTVSLSDFYAGNLYVSLHTETFPDGELRGQILPMPNAAPQATSLSDPADQALVEVNGDPATPFEVVWLPGADANGNQLAYLWQLAADAGFDDLVTTRHAGRSTSYRTTLGELERLLDLLGVQVGQEASLYHRVIASDGSLFAEGPARRIRMRRGIVTATDAADALPQHFTLHGNYPNPFNPATTLVFDLPQPAEVSVAVYDMLGRRVLSWKEGPMAAGSSRRVRLDASSLASGVYLYRITAQAATTRWQQAGRMVLVR